MNRQEYDEFVETLRRNLENDDRVIGLIATGSMAQEQTEPDEWSDHDFYVIVPSGLQEEFRNHLLWLPDSGNIVFSYRETAHGVKALYENGHLVEFAVFDSGELYLARVNRYRILFDRSDLTSRMLEIAAQTHEWNRSETQNDSYLFGQFLTGALVTYGRWERGEKCSALSFLIQNALRNLVVLITKYVPAENPDVLDNIDAFRRFESGYIKLGAELNRALSMTPPEAVALLFQLAERELASRMPGFPAAALNAVRRRCTRQTDS